MELDGGWLGVAAALKRLASVASTEKLHFTIQMAIARCASVPKPARNMTAAATVFRIARAAKAVAA
jgi:hypothetical protein